MPQTIWDSDHRIVVNALGHMHALHIHATEILASAKTANLAQHFDVTIDHQSDIPCQLLPCAHFAKSRKTMM